jgi:arginine decarboxylase
MGLLGHGRMLGLNKTSYLEYLQSRYGVAAEGPLTDFLSRQDGRLLFADRIDLSAMVAQHGAPLEIVYCPLITEQVQRMVGYAAEGRSHTGYSGEFLYAYATKANFAEEAVRTALKAGANYETSAAADVVIAHQLWRQGILPEDRFIFCNGSKERPYIDAIAALRRAGFERVVPILDDLDELEIFALSPDPMLLGVRERPALELVNPGHPGGERFGLTPAEIEQLVARLQGTPHQLVVYHAMVGSQIEDLEHFLERLGRSVEAYCRLRQRVPSLRCFNFGGGVPTSAYSLEFSFDYAAFFTRLMATLQQTCARFDVPVPDLIGEFGRYTVASHSLYLLEVGSVKEGQGDADPWYLVNGSMMVSLPDIMIVEDQQFIVLPLEGWEQPVAHVRLAGRRTCDSDDVFPRPSQAPLAVPAVGAGLVLAVFGVGAYQAMISGKGGAHHCLSPEMKRVIIEEQAGELVARVVPQQDVATLMRLLGYQMEVLEATPRRGPAPAPTQSERPWARDLARRLEPVRRRRSLARCKPQQRSAVSVR